MGLKQLAEIYEDGVLDLDLTTNRGDCLSVIGAAREVAAITGGTIIEPVLFMLESALKLLLRLPTSKL